MEHGGMCIIQSKAAFHRGLHWNLNFFPPTHILALIMFFLMRCAFSVVFKKQNLANIDLKYSYHQKDLSPLSLTQFLTIFWQIVPVLIYRICLSSKIT